MKEFKGRVVVGGTCEAEALVSHNGFNTLASFQMAIMFNKKGTPCGDQNNPEINGKAMEGKALCLPITIGSTTGGMILYTVLKNGNAPACMLFSESIDSLAASGAIMGAIWTDTAMPVVDRLGPEFLDAVKTGDTVKVLEDGVVQIL